MSTSAVVTARGSLQDVKSVKAKTPGAFPDVHVEVMTVARRIFVRAFRTFIQAFLSALGIGVLGPLIPGASDVLPPGTGAEKLWAAVLVGLGAALVAGLQLTWELSAKWDVDHPERLA